MIDLHVCHVSGRYCGRTASRDAGEMKGRVLLGLCVWTPGRSQAAPRGGRQTTVRLTGVDRHGLVWEALDVPRMPPIVPLSVSEQ